MRQFTCSQCGESHEEDPTDSGWTLPDDVWNISEEKRESEATFNADLCKFGDRYFVRCMLPLPFQDREGYFGWGTWIEVEKTDFDTYINIYEKDGSNAPRIEGHLANEIPGYECPSLLNVEIQFGPSDQRPMVYFREDDSCLIAQEQRQGIDSIRYHEILDVIRS